MSPNTLSDVMQITAEIKGEYQSFALSANDPAKLLLGLGENRRELDIKIAQVSAGDVVSYNGNELRIVSIDPRKTQAGPIPGVLSSVTEPQVEQPVFVSGLQVVDEANLIEQVPAEAISEPVPPAMAGSLVDISAANLSPEKKAVLGKIDGVIGRLTGVNPSEQSDAAAAVEQMDQKLAGLAEKMQGIPALVSVIGNALLGNPAFVESIGRILIANDDFVDALMNRGDNRRQYWAVFRQRMAEEQVRRSEVELTLIDSPAVSFSARINPADHLSDPGKVVYYVKIQAPGEEHDEHGNHVMVNKWVELKNLEVLPAVTEEKIASSALPADTNIYISVLTPSAEVRQAIVDDVRQELENESAEQSAGDGAAAA